MHMWVILFTYIDLNNYYYYYMNMDLLEALGLLKALESWALIANLVKVVGKLGINKPDVERSFQIIYVLNYRIILLRFF
jgi:hypothetical protein